MTLMDPLKRFKMYEPHFSTLVGPKFVPESWRMMTLDTKPFRS